MIETIGSWQKVVIGRFLSMSLESFGRLVIFPQNKQLHSLKTKKNSLPLLLLTVTVIVELWPTPFLCLVLLSGIPDRLAPAGLLEFPCHLLRRWEVLNLIIKQC